MNDGALDLPNKKLFGRNYMIYLYSVMRTVLLALMLVSYASYSFAEEALTEDKLQQDDKNSRDGYYFSIGTGYWNYESPLREELNGLAFVINGRYQRNGFFVELANGSSGTSNLPTLGYNFYGTEHWNLDLLYAITDGTGEFSYEMDGKTHEMSTLPISGVGFRALGSWGNTTLQLVGLNSFNSEFRSDTAVDYAALWLGHRWQIKNWSLNGLVGAKYRSSDLMNYSFGVTEREADKIVSAYETSSGVDYTAQIDLTYPIRKNVLFQIYATHTQFSDEMLHSPIIKLLSKSENRPEKEQTFGILLHYVF